MLSTPFTRCSIGVATDCSSVTASAPVYVVVIFTSGGTISGNCAIGSRSIATVPAITIRIARTIAKTGRLTKKAPMLLPCGGSRSCGYGCSFCFGGVQSRALGQSVELGHVGFHFVTGLHLLLALDQHLLAGLEPLQDHPVAADARARLDDARLDGSVRFCDQHALHALPLDHGSLRHGDRARQLVGQHANSGELTRSQRHARVGEARLEHDAADAGLYGSIDQHEPALLRI